MNNISLPQISQSELENLLSEARNSPRRRYPKILHEKGDVLNRVINFMLDVHTNEHGYTELFPPF